jgi:uncharacterized protein (TIGR00255 family)
LAQSMTAFARVEEPTSIGKVTLELRSVNNRYLDPAFRLSDAVRALEPSLRERLGAKIKRGRVELSIRLDSKSGASELLNLSQSQLDQVKRLQATILEILPNSSPMTVNEILNWPGVIDSNDSDDETIGGIVMPLFDNLLSDFIANRKREGGKLKELIEQRIANARQLVESLQTKLPEINQQVRTRLESRLTEILEKVDSDRLEQELVLLLNKSDVEEEIDRLIIHFDEVLGVLKSNQPLGRRLDFLMQELNREANTLGSKAAHADVTNASMELKVLIEQMREQVQNLE